MSQLIDETESEAGVPQPTTEEPSLQQKTLAGLGWSSFATISNAVMQIAYTSTVARLVSADAFGLVAAGAVILRFGSYFSEMGFGKALIQKKDVDERDIRAATTGTVALGIVFSMVFYASAPLVAPLFIADPRMVRVLQVMSFYFLTSSFNVVPINLLRRRMRFKQIAIIDICTFALGYGGVGLGLALHGYGIWGLIGASMSQQLMASLVGIYLTRPNMRPMLDVEAYKPLLGFGSKVSLISFLEFIDLSLDTFMIGRVLGPARLGIYNRAVQVVYLPIYNLTTSISRVLFPAMSSIQTDIPRLRRVYLSATQLIAYLIVPIGAGIAVAGREVVLVVLGDKWTEAIPILQVVAIAIPLRLLTYFAGLICDTTNKLWFKVRLEVAIIAIMGPALYYVAGHTEQGLVNVAIVVLCMEVFKAIFYGFVLRGILGYNIVKDWLGGYIAPAAAAGVVMAIIYIAHLLLPQSIKDMPLLALMIEMVAGGVGLAISLLLPTATPVKRQLYERFFAKSKFSNHPLVSTFVKS